MTRWVRQEDTGGCGAATLAMIVGCTYDEGKATIDGLLWQTVGEEPKLKPVDWSDGGGMSAWHLDRGCHAHGFFLQRRYAAWGHDLLVPFAPIHYAIVVQPSNNHHFVAVLEDGRVLDPMREGYFRLADWQKVEEVVGFVRGTAVMKREAVA